MSAEDLSEASQTQEVRLHMTYLADSGAAGGINQAGTRGEAGKSTDQQMKSYNSTG